MGSEKEKQPAGMSRQAEERYLEETLAVVRENVKNYGEQVRKMQTDIDEMLEHFHDNDVEVLTILNNTVTLHDHMKRALLRNEKAQKKPYFGRIVFRDEATGKQESLYIGRGGISRDTTHWMVVDWRAPVANVYYENGLGKCSYEAPGGVRMWVNLKRKRTYEIEEGKLLDYFDSEVIANDDLLTKYLAKNKQAVLSEIVATIQQEQNAIIRKSPYHNIIVQGVAGSGKTTVAMHRISYILYNYQERFRPDDFYIVGSNRILLNYITGVLPDLDVHGVRQMTMEQLFVRLLYEDWDEKKYGIRKTDDRGPKESIKGGKRWFRALELFCERLEWETIPRDSVFLNPRQFVEGLKDGKSGVYDETGGKPAAPGTLVRLMDGEAVERYIRQNPRVSVQSKIDMLNERLINKIKEEFLGKEVSYTEAERKAILKAYRGRYGGRSWKRSIYDLYREFLTRQAARGYAVEIPNQEFDVYDLAALAYLYKRIRETEVISEAHHVVIDEAQDFGMMAYESLSFCMKGCTYTVMGDVSQNIHFGYGLNDWEELKRLLLPDEMDSFGVLKKSYRNTVEISEFATRILRHGRFSIYPVEPIIRHGEPVRVEEAAAGKLIQKAAGICRVWQEKGLDTVAVVCRNQKEASAAGGALSEHIRILETDPEKMNFGSGIMVLPVELTKGLEFDAVLILDPDREDYPVDDGHAKLLYVAATRALHQLCVLHTGNLTGLIADPLPRTQEERSKQKEWPEQREQPKQEERPEQRERSKQKERPTQAERSKHPERPVRTERSKQPEPLKRPEPERSGPEGAAGGAVQPYARLRERERPLAEMRKRTPPGYRITAVGRNAAASEPERNASAIAGKVGTVGLQNAVTDTTRDDIRGRKALPSFGDMPSNEKLRPAGHGKIDLSVRWISRETDGLYLSSRYGTLRIRPLDSGVIRITFARGTTLNREEAPVRIADADEAWMYRIVGNMVEITTDELRLRVDRTGGAITYMTRDGKTLLTERARECRQIENGPDGVRSWLYLEWKKEEILQGICAGEAGVNLRRGARYLSHGGKEGRFPLLVSDQGYGILIPTDCPTICCDIPTYGSWLYTEGMTQMDFCFLLPGALKKIGGL